MSSPGASHSRAAAPTGWALAVPGRRSEQVVEVGPPPPGVRPKSDALDAVRAARSVITHGHGAVPRTGGPREGLRALMLVRNGAIDIRRAGFCRLRALIVSAPDGLR